MIFGHNLFYSCPMPNTYSNRMIWDFNISVSSLKAIIFDSAKIVRCFSYSFFGTFTFDEMVSNCNNKHFDQTEQRKEAQTCSFYL